MKLVILSQVLNDVIIINMSLERTVKWIDKTGTESAMQRAGTSSARLFSTPAGSSSIVSNLMAGRTQLRSSTRSSVLPHRLSQHARRTQTVPTVQEHQRGQEDKGTVSAASGCGQRAKHRYQGVLSAVLVVRQLEHSF